MLPNALPYPKVGAGEPERFEQNGLFVVLRVGGYQAALPMAWTAKANRHEWYR